MSGKLSIFDHLEQSDKKLYDKIREDEHHPLHPILPIDCKGLFSKASKKDILATFS